MPTLSCDIILYGRTWNLNLVISLANKNLGKTASSHWLNFRFHLHCPSLPALRRSQHCFLRLNVPGLLFSSLLSFFLQIRASLRDQSSLRDQCEPSRSVKPSRSVRAFQISTSPLQQAASRLSTEHAAISALNSRLHKCTLSSPQPAVSATNMLSVLSLDILYVRSCIYDTCLECSLFQFILQWHLTSPRQHCLYHTTFL